MYIWIFDFLNKRQLIYSKHFGVHSHYSTEYAVLSVIDQVQLAIEGKDYSCGIFLDFSKAFDTVNHQILFKNLTTMVSEVLLRTGLLHTEVIDHSFFLLVLLLQTLRQCPVLCPKG